MPPFDPTAARVVRELKHGKPLLFASAQDDTVQRFDLLTGAKAALVGHKSWARGLAFVAPKPAGEPPPADGFGGPVAPPKVARFTLITADYHGNLTWWPGGAATPKPARTVAAHDGWARAVAVSPDGLSVASCGNDHAVKLWKASDGSAIRTLKGHESHVYNVAFHPTAPRLVSCDLNGVVKDWDVRTGKCERDLDAKLPVKYDPVFMADIGGARGMAFRPDGSAVAVCGITNVSNAFAGVGNPFVMVIDWKGGKGKVLSPKVAFQGTAWGVAFHPSGAVIAAGGGADGRVWFWNPDDPASIHTITVPTHCRDLALSPTGDRFAVAGANGTAYVYDFNGTDPPAKK
jgi:WD40 repeat protein